MVIRRTARFNRELRVVFDFITKDSPSRALCDKQMLSSLSQMHTMTSLISDSIALFDIRYCSFLLQLF